MKSQKKIDDTLRLLEFEKVLQKVSHYCFSVYGKKAIMATRPSDDPVRQLSLGAEFLEMLRASGEPPTGGFFDISSYLGRTESGHVLDAEELSKISRTLEASCELREFFDRFGGNYRSVQGIAEGITCEHGLIKLINKCIDENHSIRDAASAQLREIRTELRRIQRGIKTKLDQVIAAYQGDLTDALMLSREGRYVIPLSASKKKSHRGIVHGSSSSGATVYFEPEELIELNDRIRVLESREKEEIMRILREITSQVFRASERIYITLEAVRDLDVLYACARYARDWEAGFVFPSSDMSFELLEARHPLIEREEVVPIDFRLGKDSSTVVITGPNTGGKTVSLKTIGLCAVMMLSGLPVLCDEGSSIPCFKRVLADIGDEQSIEQSLSTFSSHMTRIISILKKADKSSLLLLDELGAGTDPAEGAGLSMAIIETILLRGSKAVITTHLTPIKVFALETDGVENASVEFDIETLKPTYRLIMGIPGTSNAIEISRRLGLEEEIVERAREYLGKEVGELEYVLDKLHKERSAVEETRRRLRSEEHGLRERSEEFQKRFGLMKDKRISELSDEIASVERRLEKILKETEQAIALSRSQKESDQVKAVKSIDYLRSELQQIQIGRSKRAVADVQEGDRARVIETGVEGEVVAVQDDRVIISSGKMKLKLPRSSVEKLHNNNDTDAIASTTSAHEPRISDTIDIRGATAEDVPFLIEDFLVSLRSFKISNGFIIHGKGTGRLADAVWEYLRKRKPRVKDFRIGAPSEGGHGVTVIEV